MIDKLINNPVHTYATSVYDFNELSLQELLSKFFNKINECIELSNTSLKFLEWLKEQGVNSEVVKQIELMYTDGRLTEIINNLSNDVKSQVSVINEDLNNYKLETESFKVDTINHLSKLDKNKTNWINVIEYGIDNTGETDVTTQLQDLIYANEGKVIYLPTGTYLISQIKLPLATTLQGDGLMSTIIKANAKTDMIVLHNHLSAHVYIKDLFIDGSYKADRGIFAYKEEYSLQYLDNAFVMENVYVKRCLIANVQIGKEGTASIMECKLINVKCEQGKGDGLYLASKCTDSYFEGIYCASNLGYGIYSLGHNLKFVNCKTCWNGTLESPNSGISINGGSLQTLINVECQDNYGHGLTVKNAVDINIQGIFDRNGNGGFDVEGNQIAPEIATKYGIYLENANFIRLDVIGSNNMFVHTGKYTQKAVLGYRNCKNVKGDIISSHHKYYFINEDELSLNVDINVNGHKWIDILPLITLSDTTVTGLTFKQINNDTFTINGVSTDKVKLDLKGNYGNVTPILIIPKNSILKVKNNNDISDVTLMIVGNRTKILANTTRDKYVLIEEDTELSEIALSVPTGKTLNNVIVSPTIEIIPMGNN